MVAQPGTNPRVVAPSANKMATKREASSLPGEAEDVGARASSVKSTRISEAEVEMLSPMGDFAALAATPATSVAPAALAPARAASAAVPKRTRGGARSVPLSLLPRENSPARRALGPAREDNSRSPHGAPDPDLRRLVGELSKRVKKGHEEQARDRARIERLEHELALSFQDSVVYTDKAVNTLRGELSEFSARVDELMQSMLASDKAVQGIDTRFKTHLDFSSATIEKEFLVVTAAIEHRDRPPTAPPGV